VVLLLLKGGMFPRPRAGTVLTPVRLGVLGQFGGPPSTANLNCTHTELNGMDYKPPLQQNDAKCKS
jgi:hypothetical protein